ncbi:MAG: holo-ACP synthase [Nanoarchaeota archaeon]|nr:holo-ACP synthase [Nanoarchaeota archaeon]
MVLTGVDIESVVRFKSLYTNENFINIIFTKKEIDYCMGKSEPYISFAGKFCAKEAVLKAVNNKLGMKEIEIVNSSSGKPLVYIKGKKKNNISCSISHTEEYAVAFVIVNKERT